MVKNAHATVYKYSLGMKRNTVTNKLKIKYLYNYCKQKEIFSTEKKQYVKSFTFKQNVFFSVQLKSFFLRNFLTFKGIFVQFELFRFLHTLVLSSTSDEMSPKIPEWIHRSMIQIDAPEVIQKSNC